MFIDCLGFMEVNEMKKQLFGFTQPNLGPHLRVSVSISGFTRTYVPYHNVCRWDGGGGGR